MPQGLESIFYSLIQLKIISKIELEEYYSLDEVIKLFCLNFMSAEIMAESFKDINRKRGKHF